MYKNINIRDHHLRQMQAARMFLRDAPTPNTTDTRTIAQQQPKHPNNQIPEHSHHESKNSLTSDECQCEDEYQMLKNLHNQIQATNKHHTSQHHQHTILNEQSLNINNTHSQINQSNLNVFVPSTKNNKALDMLQQQFRRYSKARVSGQQQVSQKQSKLIMTKMHGANDRSIVADDEDRKQVYIAQRGTSERLDVTGKFLIANLSNEKPLFRNYRVAASSQWEKDGRIEDYKLKFMLRKFPKIHDFKNNQKAIIKCSLLGNDVFVCMPTGGGKSLTFQIMTFIQKGIYVCILPLVSLIMDQERQAEMLGIKAYSLTGAKQLEDNKRIYSEISNYQSGQDSIVVFCTPQKIIKSPQFLSIIQKAYHNNHLAKIVIDEVHCVSTWGKQFRQDYENLSILKTKFPKTPLLGLTATVTQIIKQDIIKRLGIQNCYYFQSSFNRPNLHYEVREKKKNYISEIVGIIQKNINKSGIIYCLSRKQCQQLCRQLNAKRYRVGFYHANISQPQKRAIQNSWMKNQLQIIIATIAFGMGINKPDVRFVIHTSLSKSLQNYYQESGRAGRDGDKSQCILFYRKSDKISLQSLITKNEFSDYENKNFCMKQLSNMIRYCEDRYTCRRKFQLEYLGETDFTVEQCNRTCDNCINSISYVEVDVLKQAKQIVEFMMRVEQCKQSLSQNQIIMFCKNSGDKKIRYKFEQLQNSMCDSGELRQTFKKWNKQEIDELITLLVSHEILSEKVVSMKTFKGNNQVSNIYLKVNFTVANKFIKKVQILPMKKRKRNQNFTREKQDQFSDYEFQVQDTKNRGMSLEGDQSYDCIREIQEELHFFNL